MSQEKTTIEKNVLIAIFMGWYKSPYIHLPNKIYKLDDVGTEVGTNVSNLKYDSDYDWLMPVWQKFRDLGDMFNTAPTLSMQYLKQYENVAMAIVTKPITEAFEALVSSIEWYNIIKQ